MKNAFSWKGEPSIFTAGLQASKDRGAQVTASIDRKRAAGETVVAIPMTKRAPRPTTDSARHEDQFTADHKDKVAAKRRLLSEQAAARKPNKRGRAIELPGSHPRRGKAG